MREVRRRLLLQGIGAMAMPGLAACGSGADEPEQPAGSPAERLVLGGRRLPADLPPGRLVAPEKTAKQPVLWVSDEPLDELAAGRRWAELLAQHAETGLWPLLLGGMRDRGRVRPWHTGELHIYAEPRQPNLDELFRAQWRRWEADSYYRALLEGVDYQLGPMPFSTWPGLAARVESAVDPERQAASVASTTAGMRQLLTGSGEGPYLGLTVAQDGATALAACGWYVDSPQDPAVVVRSWQHRFGIRVCTLGFDTLTVTVPWPPTTIEQARRLMVEHLLFCPDNFAQAAEPFTFEEYATWLLKGSAWSFWWD